MSAISKFDPRGLSSATVTNFSLDESYYRDDESFSKTVDLLDTYFRMGGAHFQLNYLNANDLRSAQASPEDYQSLRVRVTGYSDFFNNLSEATQNSIIERYE